jgi:hypothetical protein
MSGSSSAFDALLDLQEAGQFTNETIDNSVQNPTNGVGSVLAWPNCHPQHVLDMLFNINEASKGSNKNLFWKSYNKDFHKLKIQQQNNCVDFVLKLPPAIRSHILLQAETKTTEAAARAQVDVPGTGIQISLQTYNNIIKCCAPGSLII